MNAIDRQFLNKNFVIRISEREGEDYGRARLIGGGQLPKILEEDFVEKVLDKAYSALTQNVTIKFRRGLKIVLHRK